ncbi:recombinase family protein [Blautia sp. MSJ-9]|uniref:recombinase family protein n=1 Tax=Blautia sp. MSJ-9 TaxID=2841511 RepID=UPI001C113068|nr:recombinase family protein [Blautia sp. MSJ-9]MBU5682060.1 recombinase family protein [Blautia sp. MSJ-9]
MIYGYCRISTPRQNLERQVRNIRTVYPDAVIVREIYTGTKIHERKEFEKLLRKVSEGDTLVFDSVSRMSRTSQDGYKTYEELYNRGVSLVFLKEPHINTSTYQQAMNNQLSVNIKTGDLASDELMSGILNAVNGYMLNLARKQIQLAFEQSEKEVADLHQRTREGIETARLNGKQIGLTRGTKLVTKKSVDSKRLIQKYSRDFSGTLSDKECIKLIGISKGSYYKYKRELKQECSM